MNRQQQCVEENSELHGIMVSELNGLSTLSELNENNGTMFEEPTQARHADCVVSVAGTRNGKGLITRQYKQQKHRYVWDGHEKGYVVTGCQGRMGTKLGRWRRFTTAESREKEET